MPAGTLCREKNNECGLPERCDGASAEYPEDVHVEEGSPCSGGYCSEKIM